MNAHTALSPDQPSRRLRLLAAFGIVAGLAGYLTPVFPMTVIPVMTAALLLFVSLPKERGLMVRAARVLLMFSAPFLLAGLVRFTVQEAAPGIVEGGRRALTGRAIAKLRVIVFSQDVAREQGVPDADGDGVGSALLVSELLGLPSPRLPDGLPGGMKLEFGQTVETPRGDAFFADGYLFLLYLPAQGGGWTTDPARVDDEAAERRWIGYGWPMNDGHGERKVVFIDEHEMIRVYDNTAEPRYIGPDAPPSPDVALAGDMWPPWKDKTPRESLPGAP